MSAGVENALSRSGRVDTKMSRVPSLMWAGREDFRQAIFKAMPKMLGDGAKKTAVEEAREILQGMTAKTWRKDRERLLTVLHYL